MHDQKHIISIQEKNNLTISEVLLILNSLTQLSRLSTHQWRIKGRCSPPPPPNNIKVNVWNCKFIITMELSCHHGENVDKVPEFPKIIVVTYFTNLIYEELCLPWRNR